MFMLTRNGLYNIVAAFDDLNCICIGSALAGGSVIGAIMAGPVSNKYGRRDSLFFAYIW